MEFIESYKHLEKICGEILNDERKISAYIDEVINTPNGSHLVNGWDKDLQKLKHYRWIRNQIAHESGCSEKNMCKYEDVLWLDQFYERIMNQKDPLALYHQTLVSHQNQLRKSKVTDFSYKEWVKRKHESGNHKKLIGYLLCVLAICFVIIAVLLKI